MNNLRLLALGATLTLAACNNSSLYVGDSGVPTGSTVNLTASNAETAALAAYYAALSSADLANFTSALGATTDVPGTLQKPSNRQEPSNFLMTVISQVPYGPDVVDCQVSGTITFSGDVADNQTFTVNDFFTVSAAACDDGFGEVIDGSLTLTITSFSGDLNSQMYVVGMRADVDGLQFTTAEDAVSTSGSVNITLDTTMDPLLSAAVSGASITTSYDAYSERLLNFQSLETVDGGQQNFPFTLSASGTVDNSLLSGMISYTTAVTFEGDSFEFPGTGELLVSGNASTVRLIAIDNVNIRIEIDNNGDGIVDDSIDSTWAELTGP